VVRLRRGSRPTRAAWVQRGRRPRCDSALELGTASGGRSPSSRCGARAHGRRPGLPSGQPTCCWLGLPLRVRFPFVYHSTAIPVKVAALADARATISPVDRGGRRGFPMPCAGARKVCATPRAQGCGGATAVAGLRPTTPCRRSRVDPAAPRGRERRIENAPTNWQNWSLDAEAVTIKYEGPYNRVGRGRRFVRVLWTNRFDLLVLATDCADDERRGRPRRCDRCPRGRVVPSGRR
jgi:hypothetical protein